MRFFWDGMMRVLLVAPNCNPYGSETIIGYRLARAIAEYVDVVVVTHCFFRDSIEGAGGLGRAEAAYVDLEALAAKHGRLARRLKLSAAGITFVNFSLAIAFEREVLRRFQSDLKRGRFDLVHRVTPVSSALPSPLASWVRVPFVVGPVNGGLPYPTQFRRELWKEREWLRYVRGLAQFLPFVRSTYRKSAAILASGQHTIDRLPVRDHGNVFNMMEVGFDPTTFQPALERPSRDRLTFLFVGRLVPFKCTRIAIAAFGSSPLLRRHRLLLVGDGPERESLQEQIRSLDLEGIVELLGNRPQDEVARLMATADVFVFPSIRESGGLVVVEAMASGLACVVTDYGGPANIVTDGCGIKIPLDNADMLAARFREELEALATDTDLRNRLGAAASERVRRAFTWDSKAKMIHEVYRWVLGQRPDKPDLDSLTREHEVSRHHEAISRPVAAKVDEFPAT
jgi:glycosyltransferase involved in cell wall biosynthesis